MEHLALYRKWRPQTFEALVGQEANTRILKNAVAGNRQSHAYLFCGTRGTGKTSTARILAKALNCAQPEAGEPCNHCSSCLNITAGRSLDVFEIDAASNRGIDEVRDLLEKVHFVPAEGRFKVYIIDEAHMLTTEAFNALLKTFEEPPAHVVFILATTEPRKIPLTILSRCQRYDFRPISEDKMAGALKVIAEREAINITDDALYFLAQKAKGSMRDALSLLDQGMGAGEDLLTVESLSRILGSVLTDFWPDFLGDIAAGDIVSLFRSLDELATDGKDLRTFYSDLRELLGDIISYNGDTSKGYGKIVASCRGILEPREIVWLLRVLGEEESAFRYQRDAKVVCRFLLAKIVDGLTEGHEKIHVISGEREVKTSKDFAADTSFASDRREEVPISTKPFSEKGKEETGIAGEKGAIAEDESKMALTAEKKDAFEDKEALWSDILASVRQLSAKTFTWLSRAQLRDISDREITVYYYASDSMFRDKIQEPEHAAIVKKAIGEVTAADLEFRIIKDSEEGSLFD